MLAINCRSTVRMCQAVLPGMLSRRRGAILNIGSAAATVLPADPLYSVYAATKGFVDQLSRTLRTEVADRGVHVQLQAPLYVATKMSKIRRASLTVPTPRAVRRGGRDASRARARTSRASLTSLTLPTPAAPRRTVRQGGPGRDRLRGARDAVLGARAHVGGHRCGAGVVRARARAAAPSRRLGASRQDACVR